MVRISPRDATILSHIARVRYLEPEQLRMFLRKIMDSEAREVAKWIIEIARGVECPDTATSKSARAMIKWAEENSNIFGAAITQAAVSKI